MQEGSVDTPRRGGGGFGPLAALLFVYCAGGAVLAVVVAQANQPDVHATPAEAYGPADFPDVEWTPFEKYAPPGIAEGVYVVPRRVFMEADIFPCSQCHTPEDLPPNFTPRLLEDAHEKIALDHGPKNRWCFDCHHPDDRDRLHLASGESIEFDASHRLCGQCHGTIHRDWERGIHGRRLGYWNGPQVAFPCVWCHSPHRPEFEHFKPLPPPVAPGAIGNGDGR